MKVTSPFSFRPIEPTEYAGGVSAAARMMRAAWQLPSGPIRSISQAIEDAGGIVVTVLTWVLVRPMRSANRFLASLQFFS